jgi:O-antigen ligase
LWKSALSANDHPILGVGTGDDKEVLNNYFIAHDMARYASENLNAHNQFIQTYLSNGLLGLVSLVLLIGQPLYMGFRRDHSLTILVVFPFIIYGMTEVFLGRYQGVVFFALMHQLFVSHLVTQSKPTYTVKVV